jgi:hypothetical protein
MPIPVTRFDVDGSLIPISNSDIASYLVRTRGIKDGSSPTRELGMNNSTKTLLYMISPDRFYDTAVYFGGATTLYTDGTGKQRLSRIPPYSHPDEPLVRVTKMRSKGFKFIEDINDVGGIKLPRHQDLDIDLMLEPVPFDAKADFEIDTEMDRYIEILPDEPMAEYLNMPGLKMGLKYSSPTGTVPPHGTVIPYNRGLPYIRSRIKRKWFRIPKDAWKAGSPLFTRINGDGTNRAFIATVNDREFMGYPAHSLVLEAPAFERVFDSVASTWAYNVTYTWTFHPQPGGALGVYFFDDPDAVTNRSGWYQATTTGTYYAPGSFTLPDDKALFPERDHSLCFDVGAV